MWGGVDTICNIRLGTITNKIVLMDHLVGLINKSDRILKWNYGLARIDSPFDQHGYSKVDCSPISEEARARQWDVYKLK